MKFFEVIILNLSAFLALASLISAADIDLAKQVNEGWDLYSEVFAREGESMSREQVMDKMRELIKIYSAQEGDLMKPRVARLQHYLDLDTPKSDNCEDDLKESFATAKEHRQFKANILPYLTGCLIKQVEVCKAFIESYTEPPVVVVDPHSDNDNPTEKIKELKEEVWTVTDIVRRARFARANKRVLEFDTI